MCCVRVYVCVSILRIHAHRGCGHSSTNHSKWLLLLALSPSPLCTGPVPDQTAKHSFPTPPLSKTSDVNAEFISPRIAALATMAGSSVFIAFCWKL